MINYFTFYKTRFESRKLVFCRYNKKIKKNDEEDKSKMFAGSKLYLYFYSIHDRGVNTYYKNKKDFSGSHKKHKNWKTTGEF